MEAIFQFVDEVVEAQRDTYCAIADDIWDHPETRFEEFWSAQRLADAWRRKVFSSPAMLAGSRMPLSPASVRANRSLPCSANLTPGGTQPAGPQRGTDALDTGSQRPRLWALLGTAAFAAAVAAKGWLQQHGDSGTLRFYGCPGEEGGSGKTFMVREGLFDDVDAALTASGSWAGMFSTRTLANIQAAWRFTGTAAHAANSPHGPERAGCRHPDDHRQQFPQ